MDVDDNVPESELNGRASSDGPNGPETTASTFYIQTIPHPHNDSTTPVYLSLDGGVPPEQVAERYDNPPRPFVPPSAFKPWSPFRTRADFEYAESVVLSNMERKWVDTQLAGIAGGWSNSPSNITFRNYSHMEKSLAAARTYGVQVCNCLKGPLEL
jgi:hypothetical protein